MHTAAKAFLDARDTLLRLRSDHSKAQSAFHWPQPVQFNWALDYFDPMARGNAQTALWIVEEDGAEARYSFDTMHLRSQRMAHVLRAHGVSRGDRVMLMLPNCVELWDAMLACIKLGAVMIPATTLLTADDLADRIARAGIAHVLTTAPDAAKFDALPATAMQTVRGRFCTGAHASWIRLQDASEAPADFAPDGATTAADPLLLYFTSGTTSRPKLVQHSHISYPIGHLSTMYWIGLQPGDVHWNISSPGWAKHAWSCFFAPWNAAACIFVFNQARFNADAALDAAARCGVTTLCAPPTVWRLFIQQDLKRYAVKFRELVGAGEPLNPEIIARVQAAWGITIRDGYGQTETCCMVGNAPGQPLQPGAMGRPLPGWRLELLDPDGRPADEGEVCVALDPRPVGLMAGYAGDAEKTAQAMHHGYYHTGDVAQRNADGSFTFVGRIDDVFKASDYRISPFELESVLIAHPAVAEAAVVPSPDPVRLAVPKAFIACRTGFEPSRELALDVLRYAREHLAAYKRIRRIEFYELPKTISGKIRRVELRTLEQGSIKNGDRRAGEYWEDDFPDLRG
ncbi:MAG: AMP-binding protein [Thiomonas sp.]|uniref:Putative Acetate--coa ligase n=1 Tax=mine drainage metagenome TaxID=410659 RepID=E6PL09_9ZZZZ